MKSKGKRSGQVAIYTCCPALVSGVCVALRRARKRKLLDKRADKADISGGSFAK